MNIEKLNEAKRLEKEISELKKHLREVEGSYEKGDPIKYRPYIAVRKLGSGNQIELDENFTPVTLQTFMDSYIANINAAIKKLEFDLELL